MIFNFWFTLIGFLLIAMAVVSSLLKRLPLTTALLYLLIGFALGPVGFGLIHLDPLKYSKMLERITEVALMISVFTAGLKLRAPLTDGRWRLPVRLASASMIITIGLITLAGVYGLGLPIGAAILLGAILAPTDPVLASDVQVENPDDRDRLRFGLTGEAGLNDGTSSIFVMLGLGLLGLHELGAGWWRWLAVDVAWAVVAGLAIGALLGMLVGHLVLYLRREHKEAVGLDDFLSLGLVALAYGVALLAHAYGFLAVFAAGVALRLIERRASGGKSAEEMEEPNPGKSEEEMATDREKAAAYMMQEVLGFNEQIERIGEVAIVLLLGGLLTAQYWSVEALWFAPLLFLVIRPISVAIGLIGSRTTGIHRSLISWFGIRGIGSIYYVMYAAQHGLSPDMAQRLMALTFTVVAISIIVHGVSVTPLMNLYEKRRR